LHLFLGGPKVRNKIQWLSKLPSTRERVEVVEAVSARVTVGELGVDQALADRGSGDRFIVRALLLGLLADHADRLVVVDGEDAPVLAAQLPAAAIALNGAG